MELEILYQDEALIAVNKPSWYVSAPFMVRQP